MSSTDSCVTLHLEDFDAFCYCCAGVVYNIHHSLVARFF